MHVASIVIVIIIVHVFLLLYMQLEKHFANPRDIEFAVSEDNVIYLLQVSMVVYLSMVFHFCVYINIFYVFVL